MTDETNGSSRGAVADEQARGEKRREGKMQYTDKTRWIHGRGIDDPAEKGYLPTCACMNVHLVMNRTISIW
jgi:hypothetical protein